MNPLRWPTSCITHCLKKTIPFGLILTKWFDATGWFHSMTAIGTEAVVNSMATKCRGMNKMKASSQFESSFETKTAITAGIPPVPFGLISQLLDNSSPSTLWMICSVIGTWTTLTTNRDERGISTRSSKGSDFTKCGKKGMNSISALNAFREASPMMVITTQMVAPQIGQQLNTLLAIATNATTMHLRRGLSEVAVGPE